ncbi:glycosyltransferase [Vreelandella titanicae]|uniref:glycosyltransferase n=1 Tax=Vreelandella titanicae TaxID=664683 RepID=UPI0016813126|nr:glycosyltransferase [Halomonas titanicae]QNU64507.1 glycosyltransferase [Halomonas titanicae]
MVKNTSLSATQKRKPRLLWANPYCLLDTSSGASMTVRQMLLQLAAHGYDVQVLGATVFDNPKGMGRLKEQFPDLSAHQHQLIQAEDGPLSHQLVVSFSHNRNHFTTHEEGLWYSQYLYMLDSFKPDVVWFYGGQTLDLLIADEARDRGIPVAFYLANGSYKAPRWCRDVDLILTDSQATADMYRKEVGYTAKPVGKFIAPGNFVAEHHERKRLLFVNPSLQKGASVFVQLAEKLERERPDIKLEVVEARADWPAVLRETTRKMGEQRSALSNVVVTPNTSDMRGPYSRARVVVAPSLWWESSGRMLAEAMLNGIPALITNRGGMPEMIGNAGVAFDFPDACYEEPYQHLLSDDELQPLVDAVISLFDDEVLYQDYVDRAWQVGKEKHHLDRATDRLLNALAPLVGLRSGNKDFAITQKKRHRQRLASRATKPEFKVDNSLQQLISPKAGTKNSKSQANRLWLTDDFTWQIKGKIMVLDNRASLIKSGLADQMAATKAFGIVAFDPASEIKDAKQYEGSDYIQLFQHALLGDGKATALHACVAPEMTSTLTPLPAEKLPKRHHLAARPLAELPINTVALDSIEGLGSLDWLILDELSDAMAVLENGKKSLTGTLLIQARVPFQLTHEKQPSLAELQHWASRNGFRFYRFHNIRHYSHLPKELNARTPCATEQESADVLFLPSHERMGVLNDENKTKLAFILSAGFAAHDVAFELIADVSQEKALEFLEAQGLLPRISKQQQDSDGQSQLLSQYPGNNNDVKVNVKEVSDAGLYVRSMQAIIDNKNYTKVVQVGANDGCINDPIYEVVMRNKDKTKVLLIEPQSNILEHLEKNYAFHPEAHIANYAVGPDSLLTLYRIKPAYYGLFTKRYLHDSPNYRVPSGFSSFDKKHVIKHAQGNFPKNTKIDNAIEKLEVPSRDLLTILDTTSWEEQKIDILQVDAEGMDDKVIYSCNIEVTQPKLINFERAHLSQQAYRDLCVYLSGLNYELYNYSVLDTLAVKKASLSTDKGEVVVNDVSRPKELGSPRVKSTYQITQELGKLYEFSRKVLTEELNAIHGLDKSERFWEIVLHYFLGQRFVSRYIARWNNGLLNSAPDSEAILTNFPCRTFRDYMNKTETLVGTESPYVVSNVIPFDAKSRKLKGADSSESIKIREVKVNELLDSYEVKNKTIAYNLGVHNPKYWKAKYKSNGVDFVDVPAFDTFLADEVDWETRYRLARLDEVKPAEGYEGFWASLALCLPTELLEDFKSLYQMIEKVLEGRKPEFVFSSMLPTITSRLIAAIFTERNVPLYLHQHGPAYGEYPLYFAVSFEKRISDIFFTWGWKDEAGKAVPEKPHRLIDLKKRFVKLEKSKEEILVILPHKTIVPDFFSGTDLDCYNDNALKFYYDSLSSEEKKRVVVRLRRQHGYSEEVEKKLLDLMPGVRVDNQQRSIEHAYANAKEVVIVMPYSTSASECEYLGIPYRVLIQPSDELMQIPPFIPETYE